MALHTGSTDEQEGDYTGPAVTRAARLVDAGNGGQIILSVTTQELLSVSLPPHTELRDMGERRLKDLTRPERIFQVIAPGLPAVFPPLRTLDRAITPVPPCGPRPRSACGKRSATRTVLPSR
jgi:class 3 adenylate cyclase